MLLNAESRLIRIWVKAKWAEKQLRNLETKNLQQGYQNKGRAPGCDKSHW